MQGSRGPEASGPSDLALPTLSALKSISPVPAVGQGSSIPAQSPSNLEAAPAPGFAAQLLGNETEPATVNWTAPETPAPEEASSAASVQQPKVSPPIDFNQLNSTGVSDGHRSTIKLGTGAIVLIFVGISVAVLILGAIVALLIRRPRPDFTTREFHFGWFHCFFGQGSSAGHIRAFAGDL